MSSTLTSSSSATTVPLISVATTYSSALLLKISDLASSTATETATGKLSALYENMSAAQASLAIISAEGVLATATDASVKAQATLAIYDASSNLQLLGIGSHAASAIKYPGNIFFLSVFVVLLLYTVGMFCRSRYHGFNAAFFLGELWQVLGWAGRVASVKNTSLTLCLVVQGTGLTISPAFLMAGVYFLFAQLVVIHGREFSVLKPMWYSYLFITTDVISLFIQAGGGALTAIASINGQESKFGTIITIFGIVVQIVAMSIFVGFWFDFLNRIYFKPLRNDELPVPSPYARRSLGNYMRFLFNTKLVRTYRRLVLEIHYNQQFHDIRSRALFAWFPLAVTVAVTLIYIRCVYRVAELVQGYSGYLSSHEIFLFLLDALMVSIACAIFVPFHPVWVFGPDNKMKLSQIKKNYDEKLLAESVLSSEFTLPFIKNKRTVV